MFNQESKCVVFISELSLQILFGKNSTCAIWHRVDYRHNNTWREANQLVGVITTKAIIVQGRPDAYDPVLQPFYTEAMAIVYSFISDEGFLYHSSSLCIQGLEP